MTEQGLSYADMGKIIADMNTDGLVETRMGKLTLTEKGEVRLISLQEQFTSRNINNPWIYPLVEFQRERIGENDIYIPKYFR